MSIKKWTLQFTSGIFYYAPTNKWGYTQYELYGTGYMGRILQIVEILGKIRDMTRLCDRK